MKKRLSMCLMLALLACMLLVFVSCSGSNTKKYEMTDKTIDELIDYVIALQGISESDLALVGGREGMKTMVMSQLGGAEFSITLVDDKNVKAVLGSEVEESTYEISGSNLYIYETNGSGKVLIGTISSDKKALTLNVAYTGIPMTLYAK